MVTTEYANAYSEVLEILKYIPIEDYNKIPKKKIELFEANHNKKYQFVYDPSISLNDQNVSKIAKGIIAILFRDYWATTEQKNKIIAKQNHDRKMLEIEKQKLYNSKNIFKNRNLSIQEKSLVEFKNDHWYNKLLLFFKKIFH